MASWALGLIVAILVSGACCQINTQPPGEGTTGEEVGVLEGEDTDTDNNTLPAYPDEKTLEPLSLEFSANSSFGSSSSNNGSSIDSTSSNQFSRNDISSNSSSSNSSSSNGTSSVSVHSGPNSDIQAHLLAAKYMGSLLIFYFVTCLYLAARAGGPFVVH